MTPPDISKLTALTVFYLADPMVPRKVGIVTLIPSTQRCSFTYDDGWRQSGFALSPDLPLGRIGERAPILPALGWAAPGALDDAMPDRWAERTIRVIDRPKRMTPLDLLYFAGDRRFGALGISTEPDVYRPYPDNPLLTTATMEEANALIQRIVERLPLDERERRMIQSGRSMGGAHPKMLVAIDGDEWIAKFPNGGVVDLPLVEHATMALARACGIRTVESRVHPISHEHVVLTRRFDRDQGRRIHALSARTLLISTGGESYAAIANAIRERSSPIGIAEQRRELFARMTFNILMDNTDDHTKNHAFVRSDDGSYQLTPAYDIPPQMNGLGKQAIPVADGVPVADFGTAVASAIRFGMDKAEAVEIWRRVADGVSGWKDVYSATGVIGSDIDYLSDFIDNDEKLLMRSAPKRRGRRSPPPSARRRV